MDTLKKLSIVGLAALLVTGITACEKESGAEEVGETIDETITDVGNAVEDTCEEVKEEAGAEDQDC